MEVVAFLAVLRRYWLLMLPGALAALAAGVMALYHVSPGSPHLVSRRTVAGIAVGQTMLYSTAAPTAEIDKTRLDLADTLPRRAAMLADLMAASDKRTEIARRAGIDPKLVAVFGPASSEATVPVPLATEANKAAFTGTEPYRVLISTGDSPPIINVQADAPDAGTAAKLVQGVRATIAHVLEGSVGEGNKIRSTSLGPPKAGLVVKAPKKVLAIIAIVMVFAFWCAGVIVVMGSLPRLRRARARNRAQAVAAA
jgi:hypothetical protein